MSPQDDALVCVQADWFGWETATVRLGDVEDIHWLQPAGAPRAIAHGSIRCSDVLHGRLSPACEHAAQPHRHLVCLLKRHISPAVYAEIARRADAHRNARASDSARPPAGALVPAGVPRH